MKTLKSGKTLVHHQTLMMYKRIFKFSINPGGLK
jgi:hypothetical protein